MSDTERNVQDEPLETGKNTISLNNASQKLHRKLEGRHMQMIAICGSIGAGLFVGSGAALAKGGPGSLLLDFLIIGIMLLLTINALGELAGKNFRGLPP